MEESGAIAARIRDALLRRRPVVLRRFLDADLLRLLIRILSDASFVPSNIDDVGARTIEAPGHAGDALCLALGRPEVLRFMESLVGDARLTEVAGAVAQFGAASGDRLGWHDDRVEPRRKLAITINLGTVGYQGGVFEFRDLQSDAPTFRHVHSEPGEALLFPIGAGLQHRLLPVTAGGPRTVFAGWFLGDAN
ncbi:2OG-Fe(II) oxygenase [Sphingomonas caeni]|uniref:2OG-Fe(II) oxygenase n=1 Tax=Sphingomonas caeni TaxID=2984949 RepID=UPI002231715A|nr:2OG-Fe(II) oxygenase [Sphingomonas caeni]